MRQHNPFDVLQERHVLSIIAFLAENKVTTKGELYSEISRGNRMPDKLESLEREGLISMESSGGNNRAVISLTDKGQRVGDLVLGLRDEMEPDIENTQRF